MSTIELTFKDSSKMFLATLDSKTTEQAVKEFNNLGGEIFALVGVFDKSKDGHLFFYVSSNVTEKETLYEILRQTIKQIDKGSLVDLK